MVDLAKVQCADFAACVNQDFEIAAGRTTAEYPPPPGTGYAVASADASDEEIIPDALVFSIRAIRVIRGQNFGDLRPTRQ